MFDIRVYLKIRFNKYQMILCTKVKLDPKKPSLMC